MRREETGVPGENSQSQFETETRSTYNIVVEVEGVIDVHYTSLTSQGVQHGVFYLAGHPSRYQPRSTGLNLWQGWPSGESTCLPPMWPGFDFRTRCHVD